MTYTDAKGYLRDTYGDLIHREIAYSFFDEDRLSGELPFRECVVHHIDYDKQNNSESNLYICTEDEHSMIHRYQNKHIKQFKTKKELDEFLESGGFVKPKEEPKKGKWTEEEEEHLLSLFERKYSAKEVSEILKRHPSSIRKKLRQFGKLDERNMKLIKSAKKERNKLEEDYFGVSKDKLANFERKEHYNLYDDEDIFGKSKGTGSINQLCWGGSISLAFAGMVIESTAVFMIGFAWILIMWMREK